MVTYCTFHHVKYVFDLKTEKGPKILNDVLPHARITVTAAYHPEKTHRKIFQGRRPTNRPPHESALVHRPIACTTLRPVDTCDAPEGRRRRAPPPPPVFHAPAPTAGIGHRPRGAGVVGRVRVQAPQLVVHFAAAGYHVGVSPGGACGGLADDLVARVFFPFLEPLRRDYGGAPRRQLGLRHRRRLVATQHAPSGSGGARRPRPCMEPQRRTVSVYACMTL